MKKYLLPIVLILFLIVFVSGAQAENKVRAFTALTGGGTGALDKISVADLTDGDIAIVVVGNTVYFYEYNDGATDAEDSSEYKYIRPDDYSTDGVWYLTTVYGSSLSLPATADPIWTFDDSTASAVGTGDIYANALTATYDSLLRLYVDDSAGEKTLYVTIDGTNEKVIFAKPVDLQPDSIDSDDIASGAIDLDHLSAGAKFTSYEVSDLGDAATPSVLTTAETTNSVFSNYKGTGADHVFTMPAAHAAGNVIFTIGDEFQVDIEPNSGDLFYLNGTAMAADEHIQNTADTLGDRIVGYCVNINGTLRWMFYGDANWVEATP